MMTDIIDSMIKESINKSNTKESENEKHKLFDKYHKEIFGKIFKSSKTPETEHFK